MRRLVPLFMLLLLTSGCYHATVNTGLTPSPTQRVEQKWASSWLYGLVPPSEVNVGAQCPNGVARVETQQSFLNMVAGSLTFGIYTPMTIVAVCAN